MNTNIKISLTIYLEGIPTRSREKEKIYYKVRKKDLFTYNKGNKDGNLVVKEGYRKHYPLVPSEASQHINICEEAYEHFISILSPDWYKQSKWESLSPQLRLEEHLKRITQDMGGIGFSYEILT